MVDALRSAWSVLRERGVVIDIHPASRYTPTLALVDGRRVMIGAITRTPDAGVDAAHAARRRIVGAGLFSLVSSGHGAQRTRYRSPADVRWVVRQNENYRISAALKRRLDAAWQGRATGAVLELRRAFSLAILRRRA